MIETLLGGLLGGAFRLAPEILKWLDRKGERGHELAMQDKALEFEKLRGAQRMAEIGASADAAWNSGAIEALKEAVAGQGRLSGVKWVDETHCCSIPIRRIVMKSRVRLQRSGPSTGRLSMPSFSIGSGSWPACSADSRLACIALSAARWPGERSSACWTAISSVNADGSANPRAAGSRASKMSQPIGRPVKKMRMKISGVEQTHRQLPMRQAGPRST